MSEMPGWNLAAELSGVCQWKVVFVVMQVSGFLAWPRLRFWECWAHSACWGCSETWRWDLKLRALEKLIVCLRHDRAMLHHCLPPPLSALGRSTVNCKFLRQIWQAVFQARMFGSLLLCFKAGSQEGHEQGCYRNLACYCVFQVTTDSRWSCLRCMLNMQLLQVKQNKRPGEL